MEHQTKRKSEGTIINITKFDICSVSVLIHTELLDGMVPIEVLMKSY